MEIFKEREMLISKMFGEGYLKTEKVAEAFREVPRENFITNDDSVFAYSDYPVQIGHGQTISAPHMVAIMTELVKPRKTDKMLEIGSGSGYQAAILSKLVKSVTTVEIVPDLALFAKNNLQKSEISNVDVYVGDGSGGYPPGAPYDKVIVTCATPEIFPAWKNQVKDGGMIVAPVGGFYRQELMLVKKTKGNFTEEKHGGCVFVPLRQG